MKKRNDMKQFPAIITPLPTDAKRHIIISGTDALNVRFLAQQALKPICKGPQNLRKPSFQGVNDNSPGNQAWHEINNRQVPLSKTAQVLIKRKSDYGKYRKYTGEVQLSANGRH